MVSILEACWEHVITCLAYAGQIDAIPHKTYARKNRAAEHEVALLRGAVDDCGLLQAEREAESEVARFLPPLGWVS